MFDSVIIILLIIALIIIVLLRSPQKKSESLLGETIKKQEENILSLNNDIQAFKEPIGRLRNFLSGSTSAGSFGEWNLKSILEDVFSKDQYRENVEIIPNSGKYVEFAVVLQDGLLMPIDAKFPSGIYDKYLNAAEKLDKKLVDESEKEIMRHIKKEAKSISSKYLLEGVTTDYAILYLPSESLFQLVMNLNIKENIFLIGGLILFALAWSFIKKSQSTSTLISILIIGPYLMTSCFLQSGLFTDRSRELRETMEYVSSLKTINNRVIKVDKSSIINTASHSKIIRIALLTPNLGEGIENIKSLKSSELAWSILPKEDQKKDTSYKIIYENEVISPWKLIKKI